LNHLQRMQTIVRTQDENFHREVRSGTQSPMHSTQWNKWLKELWPSGLCRRDLWNRQARPILYIV
jgi:hypothetical protein